MPNNNEQQKFLELALSLIEKGDMDGLLALPAGQLIAATDAQREIKREHDKKGKSIEEIFKILENTTLNKIISSGTEDTPCIQMGAMVDNVRITATISTQTVPTADDWASIYRYILENNAFELLQKRLSAKACLEAAEFETIEGMSFYEQKKLALRRTNV